MASPNVGPVGGYRPSPSAKFPETFEALIKLSLADSQILMKEYGLEGAISEKRFDDEARLDNLNKLMSHFGVGFLPPVAPLIFPHPFLTFRLATVSILGRRGRARSSLVCGTADESMSTEY